MATGQPSSAPKARTSSGSVIGSVVPGTTATPARMAARREEILSPISTMASGGGPIKATPEVGDGAGEVGVLGVEAVAGVHAVGPDCADGVEDGLGVQVALGRGLPAEGVGLVSQADVEGFAVELGVHGD